MSFNKSKPVIGSSTNLESPKGLKNFEFGVGLAIVAALEDTVPVQANKALFTRNLSRSKPIPISIESVLTTTVKKTITFPLMNNKSVFHISAEKIGEITSFPPADFLSSCNLCNKKLKDKDIYMYRGEKAFCSTECRYSQIIMDERKEKCSSEAAAVAVAAVRAVDVASTSPYENGRMFTNEILAI